jgi:hypothetical protein
MGVGSGRGTYYPGRKKSTTDYTDHTDRKTTTWVGSADATLLRYFSLSYPCYPCNPWLMTFLAGVIG